MFFTRFIPITQFRRILIRTHFNVLLWNLGPWVVYFKSPPPPSHLRLLRHPFKMATVTKNRNFFNWQLIFNTANMTDERRWSDTTSVSFCWFLKYPYNSTSVSRAKAINQIRHTLQYILLNLNFDWFGTGIVY
jgi:hypothetical protein